MPFQKRKIVPIDYTNRDFDRIKAGLVEHARRYYPDTFKDFSEAGFGSLMLDTVSYVGDMLSFYLDYQANESFLPTAIEYNNVIKLARQMGYRPTLTASSVGVISLYIVIPAMSNGFGPDKRYLPILKRGSKFASEGGVVFTLAEDVDFAAPENVMVVATANSTTGVPTGFAVKAFGKVISGELASQTIGVGAYRKFLKLKLAGTNITEVVKVTDNAGHEYFEVDHLSQNIIYKSVINPESDKSYAPFVLKPMMVPRRFAVEQVGASTFLQFGYGSDDNLSNEKLVDPTKVVLNLHAKDYITDRTFDPSILNETDKLGVAPSNTSLRIVYRVNTSDNVNVGSRRLTQNVSPKFVFSNPSFLSTKEMRDIANSLEVENEKPIIGDVVAPSATEIRQRAYGAYYSQNRAVTAVDIQTMVYRMPPSFGSVKRCSVTRDTDSFKRNINIHVISEGASGQLMSTTPTIKKNLKTWLLGHKMLNDTIDILDARVVNFGIEFEILSDLDTNKYHVLALATKAMRTRMTKLKFDIGEPFRITEVFNTLKNVDGVLDVLNVRVLPKVGGIHSDARYDFNANTSADGRLLLAPENVILEVKFPKSDIRGTIR